MHRYKVAHVIDLFPREILAAKVTSCGCIFVDWVRQVQLLNNASGGQVIRLTHGGSQTIIFTGVTGAKRIALNALLGFAVDFVDRPAAP